MEETTVIRHALASTMANKPRSFLSPVFSLSPFIFLLLFGWELTLLKPIQDQEEQPVLMIAIDPVEPFVLVTDHGYAGFSIDLWDEIATELDYDYRYVEIDNANLLMRSLLYREVDIAITNIGITAERERYVDFTQPMFASGLQIMTIDDTHDTVIGLVSSIFSPTLLVIIGIAFVILNIVAHILWLIERQDGSDFHHDYWNGIQEAFYWAIVTASTVGYGDKVPKRFAGRIVAILWMLLSLFLVSYFTASVTTTLTVRHLWGSINGPDDLRGHTIGTLEGTTATSYLTSRGMPFRTFGNLQSAVNALERGDIEAIVYDAPVLQYYVNQNNDLDLRLVEPIFRHENYGIALQQGSPYLEDINLKLLELYENGTYERLLIRWFGEDFRLLVKGMEVAQNGIRSFGQHGYGLGRPALCGGRFSTFSQTNSLSVYGRAGPVGGRNRLSERSV